jgi:hypothetical protein
MKIKNNSKAPLANNDADYQPLINFFALLLEWNQEENSKKVEDSTEQN